VSSSGGATEFNSPIKVREELHYGGQYWLLYGVSYHTYSNTVWHTKWNRTTAVLAARRGQKLVDRLDDLSEYAWAYRYPTGFAEPTPGDIEDTHSAAQEAVKENFRRLPEEVQKANGPSGDVLGPNLLDGRDARRAGDAEAD